MGAKKYLNVKTGIYNGIDSISVVGPFDLVDTAIDNIADTIISEGKKNIVFDFSETTYITSSGLAVLLKIFKKCQKVKGNLYVTNITQDMYELFNISSFDSFIQSI